MITLFNIVNGQSLTTESFEEARLKIEKWASEGIRRGDIHTDGVNPTKLFKDVWVSKSIFNEVTEIRISSKKESRSYKELKGLTLDGKEISLFLEMRTSVLRVLKDIDQAVLNKAKMVVSNEIDRLIIPEDMALKFKNMKVK